MNYSYPLVVKSPPFWESLFSSSNVLGWIISSLVCIIITIIIYPNLEQWYQAIVVRYLSKYRISSKHKLAGSWTTKWYVDSSSFPKINEVRIPFKLTRVPGY